MKCPRWLADKTTVPRSRPSALASGPEQTSSMSALAVLTPGRLRGPNLYPARRAAPDLARTAVTAHESPDHDQQRRPLMLHYVCVRTPRDARRVPQVASW